MILVPLACIASFLALVSGVAAVGTGKHFNFTFKDILRRKQNALIYVWVTFSSIFSLAHLTSLATFGMEYHWGYKDSETGLWMVIHAGVAILLMAAHIHIRGLFHKKTCVSTNECMFSRSFGD